MTAESGDSREAGGRVFFTNTGRTLADDDQVTLTSVGVDIGSSTSHLVFSRIIMERLDARYVVAARETIHRSEILLTPYAAEETIDADALGAFIKGQYAAAGLAADAIDTGALILTGVAARRRNARAIGELFALQAGKMVAVSAGDALETTMAAHGSGAVRRSLSGATVMNVDIGGGTSKIAVCVQGRVVAQTALDVGARLVAFDSGGRLVRLEDAGRRFAAGLGLPTTPGAAMPSRDAAMLASGMADALFAAMRGGAPGIGGVGLLRLDPLRVCDAIDELSFSGGVAEYIYGRESAGHGDLGPLLAREVGQRIATWGPRLVEPIEGIRATVIGVSQYAVQLSGGTIFVLPLEILPLRNVAVIVPDLGLDGETIDAGRVAAAVRSALQRLDLGGGEQPVAVFAPWRGSATFQRLDAFCRGLTEGLADILARGHALIVVGDGDVGGLIGLHCRETLKLANPIVSIDGVTLYEFDYIDIGRIIATSGAVPVVIKSLIFPSDAAAR